MSTPRATKRLKRTPPFPQNCSLLFIILLTFVLIYIKPSPPVLDAHKWLILVLLVVKTCILTLSTDLEKLLNTRSDFLEVLSRTEKLLNTPVAVTEVFIQPLTSQKSY